MMRWLVRSVQPSAVLIRMAAALAVAGVFLWTATEIDPGASQATQGRAGPDADPQLRIGSGGTAVNDPDELEDLAARLAVEGSAGAPDGSLGSLVGREHTIHIHATPDGPRFTITDEAGAVLAAGLTAQQVYERFPEITGEKMLAGPMMMVDPDY